jgi:hypothetical protein
LAAQAQYHAAICALHMGKVDDARMHLEELQVGEAASEVLKAEAEALLKRLDILPAPKPEAAEQAPGEDESAASPSATDAPDGGQDQPEEGVPETPDAEATEGGPAPAAQ